MNHLIFCIYLSISNNFNVTSAGTFWKLSSPCQRRRNVIQVILRFPKKFSIGKFDRRKESLTVNNFVVILVYTYVFWTNLKFHTCFAFLFKVYNNRACSVLSSLIVAARFHILFALGQRVSMSSWLRTAPSWKLSRDWTRSWWTNSSCSSTESTLRSSQTKRPPRWVLLACLQPGVQRGLEGFLEQLCKGSQWEEGWSFWFRLAPINVRKSEQL